MLTNFNQIYSLKLAELLAGIMTHPAVTPQLAQRWSNCFGIEDENKSPENIQEFLNNLKGYQAQKDASYFIAEREKFIEDSKLPEGEKMTFDEMKHFVVNLALSELEEEYVSDGLIFLLKTLENMVQQNPVNARDIMNNLIEYIYNDITGHADESRRNYVGSIGRRIRNIESNEIDEKPQLTSTDESEFPFIDSQDEIEAEEEESNIRPLKNKSTSRKPTNKTQAIAA